MQSDRRFPLALRVTVLFVILVVACLVLHFRNDRPKTPKLLSGNTPRRKVPAPRPHATTSPAVQRPDPSIDATPPNVNLLKEYEFDKNVIQGAVFVRDYSIITRFVTLLAEGPHESGASFALRARCVRYASGGYRPLLSRSAYRQQVLCYRH